MASDYQEMTGRLPHGFSVCEKMVLGDGEDYASDNEYHYGCQNCCHKVTYDINVIMKYRNNAHVGYRTLIGGTNKSQAPSVAPFADPGVPLYYVTGRYGPHRCGITKCLFSNSHLYTETLFFFQYIKSPECRYWENITRKTMKVYSDALVVSRDRRRKLHMDDRAKEEAKRRAELELVFGG